MRFLFLVLFLVYILLSGCKNGINSFDELHPESELPSQVSSDKPIKLGEVQDSLIEAGVRKEKLQLDWPKERSYPLYYKNKNIVTTPVKGTSDFVLFYREKNGQIGYKYLHSYGGSQEKKPFEERTFRVISQATGLSRISESIEDIDTKIDQLSVRNCDPVRCPWDDTFWDWIKNTWNNFKGWAAEAMADVFTPSTDGGYSGSTPHYFMSNGYNSWGTSPTYSGIPSGEVGVRYSGTGSGFYDEDGEIFDLSRIQALNILPNLDGENPEYGEWLEDYHQEAGEIWMFLNDNNYSSESKKAAIKYIDLMLNDAGFRSENVSLTNQSFLNNPQAFTASAVLYENYKSEVGANPIDPYQWQLAMEVFREEIVPLGLEFIPVVGDFIGSYNDFQSGNYFMGCAGIILAVVPSNEIYKVIDDAPTIVKGWKSVRKIFTLWNKLFTTSGGQKVLNKLPQSWKDLPGSKLTNNEKGLYWSKDNYNNLRIMDANPNSDFPNQRVPYIRVTKNGTRLDKYGNPVQSNNPNFEELTHIPLSEVTDTFLDTFFN